MSKLLISRIFKYFVLCFFSFVFLFPVYWVVISSFKTDKSIFSSLMPFNFRSLLPDKTLYLEAFKDLIFKWNFMRAIYNTIVVTVSTTILGIIINSMCAFAFSVFSFKGKKFLFVLTLITFMIPFGSIALPLYIVVGKLKLIDTYWALILPAAANGLCIFLFRQFFLDIPVSYLDAALLDGANWITVYLNIYLRMSIPIIISAGIILFVDQWEAFMWPLIAGRTRAMKVIQVAIADLAQDTEIFWNQIFAGCTISIIIPILIILPLQKYYIIGITQGGIKE